MSGISKKSDKDYPKLYVPPSETQEHRNKRVAAELKAFYGKAILDQWRKEAQEAHEKQRIEDTKNKNGNFGKKRGKKPEGTKNRNFGSKRSEKTKLNMKKAQQQRRKKKQ